MTRRIARKCDMGSGLKLELLLQDDGDVIVQVMPDQHCLSSMAIEFCNSGTQSRRTTAALHDLYKAMQADEADRPHHLQPKS